MVRRVDAVDQLHHLVVHTHHLRKLPGIQGVGEGVSVHGFNAGKTHGAFDLWAGIQLLQ